MGFWGSKNGFEKKIHMKKKFKKKFQKILKKCEK